MMVNRFRYFRWNARVARIGFAYMVAFPAFMGFIAYRWEVRRFLDGWKARIHVLMIG